MVNTLKTVHELGEDRTLMLSIILENILAHCYLKGDNAVIFLKTKDKDSENIGACPGISGMCSAHSLASSDQL